jgi:tRNA(Ile2)-agmatinylcytidine synthase
VQLHIGIDDTDSTKGGCTTYIAARLVEIIARMGICFIDFPNIIRLNPNIPYKTRGNAAVTLRVDLPNEAYSSIQEAVLHETEQNSDLGRTGTDPAVVFVKGRPTNRIKQFSRRALWDILRNEDATRILRSSGDSAAAYGTNIGLVGALAAVGQTLDGDHTFELVAYRTKPNYGTQRQVDENSVKRMDKLTAPRTFNNYDYENKRMLITPHGPDPVLLGIRGETSKIVKQAFSMVRIHEPVDRWVIFRTNHGTDAHFQNIPMKKPIEPDRPAVLTGTVSGLPRRISGGHVFFTLLHRAGRSDCAAFEPTGRFREIVASLLPGDQVTVYGRAKKGKANPSLTINLEKIQVHHLVEKFDLENPTCPSCYKHMKSAGRGQGFRCEKCFITLRKSGKRAIKKPRSMQPGLYVPALRAHRHLTKPLSRYGREKIWDRRPPSGKWHDP